MFCAASALAAGPATSASSTTRPESTSVPVDDRAAEAWIAQLGDPRYARREEAQDRLIALGDAAIPALLKHLDDRDVEIARRVVAILPMPRSPTLRVETAIRLIAGGDRERLRRAVSMLFENPESVIEPFNAAIRRQPAAVARICKPIAEQLADWKSQDDRARQQLAKLRTRDPAAAARLESQHRQTLGYMAEAAYWLALDVRDSETGRHPQTRPGR